ncbi:MAG: hypothetical protein AVDCRST_MAG56-3025 [uncultured Cytophagales bacterium]|uniref:Uncharacterized protein n=1 Tax=uncultured Cytophagales bacterium TaxID=158755 RepID=A0A6J4J5N8_9SPHI|nr:MAG: hypothetical protein AVDCRST_MAG56-3025 [uncultured Cytophagales bacterium]
MLYVSRFVSASCTYRQDETPVKAGTARPNVFCFTSRDAGEV